MQKKPAPQEHSGSNWESNLKKQERTEMMKKVAIWGGVIIACLAGLVLLVRLASNTGPTAAPVVNENLKAASQDDIVLGNPEAKVVIYEYADFQCPACASYNPIVNQVLANYDGKVKVVYRFFPLRSIHKNAIISGQAGYAAWKLGKFSEMKDLLYENQAEWENEGDPKIIFIKYARNIGLDEAEFEKLMNSDEAKQAVEADEKEAIGLGLNSTPSFFIGNKQFSPSGFDGMKALIDQELSGTVTQAPLQ